MSLGGKKIIEEIILHEILGTSSGVPPSPEEITHLEVDGGSLWVYDGTRTKWLSSSRTTFYAAEKGRAKNKYLIVADGQTLNLSGFRIPRKATITAAVAQTKGAETWNLRIRKNGNATNLASLSMTAVNGNHSNSLNIDLDEGDRIQLFAETTTLLGIKDPLVWIEIAWRNDTLPAP